MAKVTITLEDNPDGESFSMRVDAPEHGEECTPICHALFLIMSVIDSTHYMGEPVDAHPEVRH